MSDHMNRNKENYNYSTCTMTSFVNSTEEVDVYRQTKASTGKKKEDLVFGHEKLNLPLSAVPNPLLICLLNYISKCYITRLIT